MCKQGSRKLPTNIANTYIQLWSHVMVSFSKILSTIQFIHSFLQITFMDIIMNRHTKGHDMIRTSQRISASSPLPCILIHSRQLGLYHNLPLCRTRQRGQ